MTRTIDFFKTATPEQLFKIHADIKGKEHNYTEMCWGHALQGFYTISKYCTECLAFSIGGICVGDTLKFNSVSRKGKVAKAVVLYSESESGVCDMYKVVYSVIEYN